MNIGLFVTSLAPAGASQRRFQESILTPLLDKSDSTDMFFIFSYDTITLNVYPKAVHIPLGKTSFLGSIKRKVISTVQSFCYHLGYTPISSLSTFFRLVRRSINEPYHYSVFRRLNIRILYNVNQHWLPSPVPFIQTVWDSNQRVLSTYPEFSYSRFGFDALDSGIAQSLAQASYVVTGTEVGAQQLISFYGLHYEKIRVVPFPAPVLPKHLQSTAESISEPYLFYPARLWPHKNHSVLIHSLAILKDLHNINLRLVLTGKDEGNLAHILDLAFRLNVQSNLSYLGEVDDADLHDLYRNALALTFVSSAGPDNLPPLEAMSIGCPVIVSRTPGSIEQLRDSALFFSTYDAHDLACQIRMLHDDESLRSSLISKGYQLARRLSPLSYVSSIHDILDDYKLIARNWPRCDQPYT